MRVVLPSFLLVSLSAAVGFNAACSDAGTAASAPAAAPSNATTGSNEATSRADAGRTADGAADGAADAGGPCVVSEHTLTSSSDFYGFLRLAVDGAGAGIVTYGANGVATGQEVSGTFLQHLGASAAPIGAPSKLGDGLASDGKPTPTGFVASVASSFTGVEVVWMDPTGSVNRTTPIADSVTKDRPSVASAGGTTFVAWIRDSNAGGAEDALWIAGFSSTGTTFAPRAISFVPTRRMRHRLVTQGTSVWLIASGETPSGTPSTRWATIDADGTVGASVTAASYARPDFAVMSGDDLAISWRVARSLTPTVAWQSEVRVFSVATGAKNGSLTFGATQGSFDSPALAVTPSGFALALGSDDSKTGTLAVYDLSPTLGVRRSTPVTHAPLAYADGLGVDVASSATGAVFAAWADQSQVVHTASVHCSP